MNPSRTRRISPHRAGNASGGSRPNRRLRALAVLFGACVGLLLLEVGVRAWGYLEQMRRIEAWQALAEGRKMPPRANAPLGQMMRISRHPDIVYELIPNLSGALHQGQLVTINQQGFRGPAYPEEPPPGAVRIVGIGDSIMFGWGVPEELSFLRVLETMLNEAGRGARYEVINTGVPGYNAAIEVATLEHRGLAFRPDVVIMGFVENDMSLPNFIARREDFTSPTRSFLAELVLTRLGALEREAARVPLVRAPRRRQTEGILWFEDDPERAPREYRYMLGIEGYRRAVRRLARLADEHGFRVLVIAYWGIPEPMRSICEELGFTVLDVMPEVEAYMERHAIREYAGSELTLNELDPHPSAIQHRLIAEMLYRELREESPRRDTGP